MVWEIRIVAAFAGDSGWKQTGRGFWRPDIVAWSVTQVCSLCENALNCANNVCPFQFVILPITILRMDKKKEKGKKGGGKNKGTQIE